MRFPPYGPCDRAELTTALRWAQRKLHLGDWDLDLCLSKRAAKRAGMSKWRQDYGGCKYEAGIMHAWLTVNRERCESGDRSPVWVLFHEVTHVAACALLADLDPKLRHYTYWERLADRTTGLLCDLWQAEGRTL